MTYAVSSGQAGPVQTCVRTTAPGRLLGRGAQSSPVQPQERPAVQATPRGRENCSS